MAGCNSIGKDSCSGLNKKCPALPCPKLGYLNIGSLVHLLFEKVMEPLGGGVLLEEVRHWGRDFPSVLPLSRVGMPFLTVKDSILLEP